MKICNKCKEEKPLTDFPKHGKNTRRGACGKCFSDYNKKRYFERKKILDNFKSAASCAKCGEKRPYTLDFHHIDPLIKDNNISRMLSNLWDMSKIFKEIEKCMVLCKNCHSELHYLDIPAKDYLA